jgi:hypothetical protein
MLLAATGTSAGASLAPVIQLSRTATARTTRSAITGPSSGQAATIAHAAQVGRLFIARSPRHANLGHFARVIVDDALTDIRRGQRESGLRVRLLRATIAGHLTRPRSGLAPQASRTRCARGILAPMPGQNAELKCSVEC